MRKPKLLGDKHAVAQRVDDEQSSMWSAATWLGPGGIGTNATERSCPLLWLLAHAACFTLITTHPASRGKGGKGGEGAHLER